MSLCLRQIKLHCPTCGEYIWIPEVKVYDLNTKTSKNTSMSAVCPKCDSLKYIQMLESAEKIEPLKAEERK